MAGREAHGQQYGRLLLPALETFFFFKEIMTFDLVKDLSQHVKTQARIHCTFAALLPRKTVYFGDINFPNLYVP